MINYWTNSANAFGIEEFIAQRAPALGERIRVCLYESLDETIPVTRGAHLFTALDQLTPAGREAVTFLYDRIAEGCPGDPLLNDPRRVLGRYDLLDAMYRSGINRHRVHRAAGSIEAAQFPVFLREETGHDGALTGLLRSPHDVSSALRSLRARGFRIANLLVVEFCDVSDAQGVYRMGATFRIGERIVPAFTLRGTEWMLKWRQSDKSEAALQELMDNMERNPHEAWARQVFELGGVGYGRLDYGVRGNTLHAWEINTGPTVGPSRGPTPPPFAPAPEAIWTRAKALFVRNVMEAFTALDPEPAREQVTIRLPPPLVHRAQAEMAAVRQRSARLGVLRKLYGHPMIGKPFRALYSWLLPRR